MRATNIFNIFVRMIELLNSLLLLSALALFTFNCLLLCQHNRKY